MKVILTITSKEFADGLRNRWIIIVSLLMAGLAIIIALLGSVPTGATKVSSLAVMVVSLASLGIFFVPMIALLLSYDSIALEKERGTLILLLSYPLARWQVVTGKFCGHFILLSLAISFGYSIAGATLAITSSTAWHEQAWMSFFYLIISSILLGAVFLALGMLISSLTKERGSAAGAAIGVWLLFSIVYDIALISMLTSEIGSKIDPVFVKILLFANPSDIYRMFNLTGTTDVAILSGMAGLTEQSSINATVLLGILFAWVAISLTLACIIFNRRIE